MIGWNQDVEGVVGGEGHVKVGQRQLQYLLASYPLRFAKLATFGTVAVTTGFEDKLHRPTSITLVKHAAHLRGATSHNGPDDLFLAVAGVVLLSIVVYKQIEDIGYFIHLFRRRDGK